MTLPPLARYLPILDWGRRYNRDQFGGDLLAGVIVTIMLIPQSLAYALLAGLPAHVGLYASILPLAIYAVFGTSRTLSVGPVAVASLMTAAALAPLADTLEQAFIYGSVAKGDAHAGSDVDVMLIGDDLSYSEVMELLAPAEQQLQRTINPTLYSPAEFEQRIKDNQSFVTRVLDQPRLDLRFSH